MYYHRNTPEPPSSVEGEREASPAESEPGMQCAEIEFSSDYTDPCPDEKKDVSINLTILLKHILLLHPNCVEYMHITGISQCIICVCIMQSYQRWSSVKSHGKSDHLARSDSEGELNTATGIYSSFNDYQFN